MRPFVSSLLIFTLCQTGMGQETVKKSSSDYDFKLPPQARELLSYYCYECHDSDRDEGMIQLNNLESLKQPARLEVLNKVLEQVYSGEMPTKKGEQPTEKERDALASWAWTELKIFNASKLEDKLRYYRYGNYVNHDKLFRGDIKKAAFSPPRRWKINELIYQERINDIFELKDRSRRKLFHGLVKPFNLPTESGVKYYDNQAVEGGQFLTLMSNAKWVVDKQLRAALVKSGEFKFSKAYLDIQANNKRKLYLIFPDERWNPKSTAQAFERVITQEGTPSDTDLKAAITHQFSVVLQRVPTNDEMSKYLKFTKDTMKLSDKTSALKKMMTSIIMEPEFLYRGEFGDDKPDDHGRTMVTPREASYAIAYALTDRIPDAQLVQAVQSGKLNTREDLKREILRLLEDDSIEKPRILRFFQDYFGYYGVFDVFKDEERFIGHYNPHRVVAAKYIYRIPGKVSREADTLVNWILKQDKKVFETLLTTDKFFVHHTGDNEEMVKKTKKAIIKDKQNRKTYNALKNLKGKKLREAAQPYIKKGLLRGRFDIDMNLFRILYGDDGNKGLKRLPMPADLLRGTDTSRHSVKMYNLDYRTWSYEPIQPIKINNRAGILTHPAWLVSHSHNAATDPILRGKWIREKLLGGFIADVPITVDAKVPEDPHKTLREKFSITTAKDCKHCHEKMNPLGFVLESYDDFGRFRTQEEIEYPENLISTGNQMETGEHGVIVNYKVNKYKSKAVNPLGYLQGTGNKALDGKVKNAEDMMQRLAKSDLVRQVFIRNVFRYFMGRNEMLSDSQTLIQADKAYLESGGSFKALIVSLLTSDSFIYRK
jgi:hypothetical protein